MHAYVHGPSLVNADYTKIHLILKTTLIFQAHSDKIQSSAYKRYKGYCMVTSYTAQKSQ